MIDLLTWMNKLEQSFLELKYRLASLPIMVNFDTHKCFEYISHHRLGCVWIYKNRVVDYV